MDTIFLWILGVLLVPLIFGSYGFSLWVYSQLKASIVDLWKDIEQIRTNELVHIEQRLRKLEDA